MNFIGVDPGLNGALARITAAGAVDVWDCPVIITAKGKNNYHNRASMAAIVRQATRGDVCLAVIEAVHFDSRDDSHRRSAEYLIRSAECWYSLLLSSGAAVVHLHPVEWRSKLGLPKGLSKSDFVTEAVRRFPAMRNVLRYEWRGRMVDKDGRAEALLQADLARILVTGINGNGEETRALQTRFSNKNLRSLAPNEVAM